jgi:shikimate kinase
MKNNIVLIGFMGVGKSAVAQVLAKKSGWQFIETDTIITQMAGKSIPEIFRGDGEIAFREMEIAAVKQVAGGQRQVIACGGGVVLNTINIARLRETGIIILLTASPQTVLKRTTGDGGTRPLLADVEDSLARIKKLLEFRQPFYERAADITINTSRRKINIIADMIIDRIRNYEGFSFPQ